MNGAGAHPEDHSIPLLESESERSASQNGRRSQSSSRSRGGPFKVPLPARLSFAGVARHTLGILLLLTTVVLWTTSNFLASTMFADNTYSKPYFVTYINSAFFTTLLPVCGFKSLMATNSSFRRAFGRIPKPTKYSPIVEDESEGQAVPKSSIEDDTAGIGRSPSEQLLLADSVMNAGTRSRARGIAVEDMMIFREIARLSFEFCFVWSIANYATAVCLEYTTVASSTILTSTSSVWTLVFGALLSVEKFTLRKLIGVLASLAGIVLISGVDLSGNNDKNRGSFPHKSQGQIAIGDALAFASAILYGVYTTLMKKRMGNEARVDMMLFFGLVGLYNVILLLPGFLILHYTGVERFELPPTKRILTIVLVNSATSLVSDICWAYAMLLTSPLVVTVGLSLTIPLSLIGQMILNSQSSSATYWIGAGVVFLSFVFINHESKDEEEKADRKIEQGATEEHDSSGNYDRATLGAPT